MKEEHARADQAEERKPQPYRIRLPGFVDGDEIGLGDVVQRAAYAAGIRPCRGCQNRAVALNRWIVFRR